jgi:hypothetical protein
MVYPMAWIPPLLPWTHRTETNKPWTGHGLLGESVNYFNTKQDRGGR